MHVQLSAGFTATQIHLKAKQSQLTRCYFLNGEIKISIISNSLFPLAPFFRSSRGGGAQEEGKPFCRQTDKISSSSKQASIESVRKRKEINISRKK